MDKNNEKIFSCPKKILFPCPLPLLPKSLLHQPQITLVHE